MVSKCGSQLVPNSPWYVTDYITTLPKNGTLKEPLLQNTYKMVQISTV